MLPVATRALLDAISANLLVVDERSEILYTNSAALSYFGRSLIGRQISEVIFSVDRHLGEAEACLSGEVSINDESRHFEVRLQPLPRDAFFTKPAWMVVFTDQTEAFRVKQERERLMEMAAINEVLPTILHEFKNPLASIKALVELLVEECEDEHLQTQLHGILMEIRRMNLGFEGLGSATRKLSSKRNQAVDFAVKEACVIFERLLERAGIVFEAQVPSAPLLPLDSGGLRGILFNLINNAKQACERGDRIRVSAHLNETGRDYILEVADTGKGMSEEVLKQCTELFYTTKRMGSGIGLALCRGAVEKMGGRLDVASRLGEGTTITITLPVGQ